MCLLWAAGKHFSSLLYGDVSFANYFIVRLSMFKLFNRVRHGDISVILSPGKMRQENHGFGSNLDYIVSSSLAWLRSDTLITEKLFVP